MFFNGTKLLLFFGYNVKKLCFQLFKRLLNLKLFSKDNKFGVGPLTFPKYAMENQVFFMHKVQIKKQRYCISISVKGKWVNTFVPLKRIYIYLCKPGKPGRHQFSPGTNTSEVSYLLTNCCILTKIRIIIFGIVL